MKVICAGLMKTGTKSLAKALRELGFSVYDVEEHVSFHLQPWCAILGEDKEPDFLSMYRDVDAVTDVPANIFYEEILKAFPDAKVILSERDSEDVWLASWIKQLEQKLRMEREPLRVLLFALSSSYRKSWKTVLRSQQFVLGFPKVNVNESKFLLKKKYREYNERVKAVVPPDQLLVYNVKQRLGTDLQVPWEGYSDLSISAREYCWIHSQRNSCNSARSGPTKYCKGSSHQFVIVGAGVGCYCLFCSDRNSLIELIESFGTKWRDYVGYFVCTSRMISYSSRGERFKRLRF